MTDYNKQAQDFLESNSITLDIREAVPQKKPLWCKDTDKHGIHYSCTLKNKDGKEYVFDFWDNIANKENNSRGFPKRLKAYDILACIDTHTDGYTFEDFCFNFGYDDDSINAKKTYDAVQYKTQKLKEIFTPEQCEQLNDIN